MKILLLIGSGSFLGGIMRYLLSQFVQIRTPFTFPLGTLIVNILGCLLIGLIVGYIDRENIALEWRFFLITGLLGGFTTFSAFSMESINLFRDGHLGYALIYITLSIMLGLLATFISYSLISNK